MAFFGKSNNVRIYGGEFNHIKGHYTVYDNTRHETNINSHNVRNNKVYGSNNVITNYDGMADPHGQGLPDPADQQRSRAQYPSGSRLLPGLEALEDPNLLRGGRRYDEPPAENRVVFNYNSHNVEGNEIRDTDNHEYVYEEGYRSKGKRRKHSDPTDEDRRASKARKTRPGSPNEAGDEDEGEDELPPSMARDYQHTAPQQHPGQRGAPNPSPAFSTAGGGFFNNLPPGQYAAAPGFIQPMGPETLRTFKQMMRAVNEEPPSGHISGEGTSMEEDSEEESEDEGELVQGINGISLDEGALPRGRNKSGPSRPKRKKRRHTPPQDPRTTTILEFGPATFPLPPDPDNATGPQVNYYQGPVVKHDFRHFQNNYDSFNVQKNKVKDAYNKETTLRFPPGENHPANAEPGSQWNPRHRR